MATEAPSSQLRSLGRSSCINLAQQHGVVASRIGPANAARFDLSANSLLRIRYIGDVARLTLNGRLIADNFYAGREFDLGIRRYAPEILDGDLRLEILPLREDAPIYMEPKNRPEFGTNNSLLKLESIEVVH